MATDMGALCLLAPNSQHEPHLPSMESDIGSGLSLQSLCFRLFAVEAGCSL